MNQFTPGSLFLFTIFFAEREDEKRMKRGEEGTNRGCGALSLPS
jgi:hypothetical protein